MRIKIKVKPNSQNQGVEKDDDKYLIRLKSPAKDGKANLELLKLLERHFKKSVKIKSGLKSRNKIIEVIE